MCGFLGILNKSVSPEVWEEVSKFISYRGELWGMYESDSFQILSRRLARHGDVFKKQPILTPSGGILAFNGEIYNKQELAQEADIKNAESLIDSEVLALFIEKYGTDRVHELVGEFSFSYYNPANGCLILAKDRMGTKPLYWSRDKDAFAFGSSAAGVRKLLYSDNSLEEKKVFDFIRYSVAFTGNCYQGIESLQPGKVLTFENGDLSIQQIHSPAITVPIGFALDKAVQSRFEKERTGLAYSGGLDSSLIKGLADKHHGNYAFKLNLDTDSKLQNGVKNIQSSFEDMEKHFEMMASHGGRPITSSLSSMAMSTLFQTINESGLKICLSGEGADEIFLGYPTYFQTSKGHPGLLSRIAQIDLIEKLFEFKIPMGSKEFKHYCETPEMEEWVRFDRSLRLPEHLLRLNNDIPSLLNSIESRTPFLDLFGYSDEVLKNKKLNWNLPKQQLKTLAKNLNIEVPIKGKIGLFAGFELLTFTWIQEAVDYILQNKSVIPGIFESGNLADNLSRISAFYLELDSLDSVVKIKVKRTINMIVFGLWSFIKSREFAIQTTNNFKGVLPNEYTRLTNKDGYILSQSHENNLSRQITKRG